MNEYDLDLYKSLRAESATYNDKLQTLWLQKLTLCGAVAAFIVIQADKITSAVAFWSPMVVGVCLIMVLALTIDFKVLEFGLHVRAISRFIVREYAEERRVAGWEGVLWGDADAPERPLVLARSALTIFSAAMPTIALLAITSWLIATTQHQPLAYVAGGVIGGLYVVVLLVSVGGLFSQWRRAKARARATETG